jgi:hypothetical protein
MIPEHVLDDGEELESAFGGGALRLAWAGSPER